MALKLSTGLRQSQLGVAVALDSTGITLTITTTHTISITAGTDNILTKGFRPGDVALLSGMPTGANNDHVTITSIATDGQSCVVSETLTNEAGGGDDCMTLVNGKGAKQALRYGILDIYEGTQPADADTAENGTLLVSLTDASGAFTAGTSTNGLEFDEPAAGVFGIKAGQTWSGEAVADGTAGYGRYYDNEYLTGASTTARRFDGGVGVSGRLFTLSNLEIVAGQTVTCDALDLTHEEEA